MSDNEVKEMFGYLTKDQDVSSDKLKTIFQSVYKDAKPTSSLPASLSKADFETAFQKVTQPERVDE